MPAALRALMWAAHCRMEKYSFFPKALSDGDDRLAGS